MSYPNPYPYPYASAIPSSLPSPLAAPQAVPQGLPQAPVPAVSRGPRVYRSAPFPIVFVLLAVAVIVALVLGTVGAKYVVSKAASSNCLYGSWSAWEGCDALDCRGTAVRTRSILQQSRGDGAPCVAAELVELGDCGAIGNCQGVSCVYGSWSDYMSCTQDCNSLVPGSCSLGGQANTFRTRDIVRPNLPGGLPCTWNDTFEVKQCQDLPGGCPQPIPCTMGEWGPWSGCDAAESLSCAIPGDPVHVEFSFRTITQVAANGGAECNVANMVRSRTCAAQPPVCAASCTLGSWSSFSTCSVPCGMGTHWSAAEVLNAGGPDALCLFTSVTECTLGACPVGTMERTASLSNSSPNIVLASCSAGSSLEQCLATCANEPQCFGVQWAPNMPAPSSGNGNANGNSSGNSLNFVGAGGQNIRYPSFMTLRGGPPGPSPPAGVGAGALLSAVPTAANSGWPNGNPDSAAWFEGTSQELWHYAWNPSSGACVEPTWDMLNAECLYLCSNGSISESRGRVIPLAGGSLSCPITVALLAASGACPSTDGNAGSSPSPSSTPGLGSSAGSSAPSIKTARMVGVGVNSLNGVQRTTSSEPLVGGCPLGWIDSGMYCVAPAGLMTCPPDQYLYAGLCYENDGLVGNIPIISKGKKVLKSLFSRAVPPPRTLKDQGSDYVTGFTCPLSADCEYQPWEEANLWGMCNESCHLGGGTRKRVRKILKEASFLGAPCEADELQLLAPCNLRGSATGAYGMDCSNTITKSIHFTRGAQSEAACMAACYAYSSVSDAFSLSECASYQYMLNPTQGGFSADPEVFAVHVLNAGGATPNALMQAGLDAAVATANDVQNAVELGAQFSVRAVYAAPLDSTALTFAGTAQPTQLALKDSTGAALLARSMNTQTLASQPTSVSTLLLYTNKPTPDMLENGSTWTVGNLSLEVLPWFDPIVQGVPQLATAPVPMMSQLSAQGSSREKCDENFPLFQDIGNNDGCGPGPLNFTGFPASSVSLLTQWSAADGSCLLQERHVDQLLYGAAGQSYCTPMSDAEVDAGVQYSVVDMPCDQELDCQLSAFSLSVPCPPCGPPYQATWVRSITQAERAGGKPCSDFLMHSYSSCQPRPVACSALPNTQHCLYNEWPTIQSADACTKYAGDARLPLFAEDAWAVSTRLAWANASEVLSVQTSGAPIPASLARVINTQCLNASPSAQGVPLAPQCVQIAGQTWQMVYTTSAGSSVAQGWKQVSTCSANALAADAAFSSCVAQRLASAPSGTGTSPQYFDAQAQQWTCPSLCPWVPEVCQWSACDATCSSAQHVPQQSVVRGITQMAPDCSQAELVLEQPCSLSASLPQCPTMEDCPIGCDGTPCGEVSGRGTCSMNTYTGNYQCSCTDASYNPIDCWAACPRDANGLECGGSLSGICTEEGVCLCNKGLYGPACASPSAALFSTIPFVQAVASCDGGLCTAVNGTCDATGAACDICIPADEASTGGIAGIAAQPLAARFFAVSATPQRDPTAASSNACANFGFTVAGTLNGQGPATGRLVYVHSAAAAAAQAAGWFLPFP